MPNMQSSSFFILLAVLHYASSSDRTTSRSTRILNLDIEKGIIASHESVAGDFERSVHEEKMLWDRLLQIYETLSIATSSPTLDETMVSTPAETLDDTEEPSTEPSTTVPPAAPTQTAGGTASPTEVSGPWHEPLIRVRVRDFFIAYVIPDFTTATDEEIDALLQVTEEFWEGYFQERYPVGNAIQYRGIQLVINEVRFGAGIPDEKFNLWIDFNTTILYELDSADPPDVQETFDIMASAEFTNYILQYVRQLTERTGVDPNPFRWNNEVVFRASERIIGVRGQNNVPASGQVLRPMVEKSEDSNIPLASIIAAGAVALSLGVIGMLVAKKSVTSSQDYGKAMMEAETFEETVTDETSMK